jgi:hypothetical protein
MITKNKLIKRLFILTLLAGLGIMAFQNCTKSRYPTNVNPQNSLSTDSPGTSVLASAVTPIRRPQGEAESTSLQVRPSETATHSSDDEVPFVKKVIPPGDEARFGCGNYPGTKCVFLCNRYPGDKSCQNPNPNVCIHETSPGLFRITSRGHKAATHAADLELIEVSLPYHEEVLSDPSGNGRVGITIARLANQESDCRNFKFYDPDFKTDAKAWYKKTDFNEFRLSEAISFTFDYYDSVRRTYRNMNYFERCSEVPQEYWANEDLLNWMLYVNPGLNKEPGCTQYHRTSWFN